MYLFLYYPFIEFPSRGQLGVTELPFTCVNAAPNHFEVTMNKTSRSHASLVRETCKLSQSTPADASFIDAWTLTAWSVLLEYSSYVRVWGSISLLCCTNKRILTIFRLLLFALIIISSQRLARYPWFLLFTTFPGSSSAFSSSVMWAAARLARDFKAARHILPP